MSINQYLKDLGSNLVLSDAERSHINTSIDTIIRRLDLYFSDINDVKIFGSYTRGTILPRKADENSDIDILIEFSNSNKYKPQSFMNRLKDFAECYYSSSEIYQSSPTIVLELSHIKFELTPSYKTNYGWYYIPQDSSEWMITDPDGFYKQLDECNKNNNYKIKPIIRLLKHWNIQKNGRKYPSYKMEKKIAETMKYADISCVSFSDYLLKALRDIKYETDWNKVDEALDSINKALDFEKNNMPNTALSKVKEVFPEV